MFCKLSRKRPVSVRQNDSDSTLTASSDDDYCSAGNISSCISEKKCWNNSKCVSDDLHVSNLAGDKSSFFCELCNIIFKGQKYLKQHMRKKHNKTDEAKSSHKCPECKSNISKRAMEQHLLENHDIELSHETLQFNSLKEFESWKTNIEKTTKTRFRQLGSNILSNKKYSKRFICHRSGDFVSKSKGKRHLKMQGSNKINCYCPASINIVMNDEGSCSIKYISTHLGHKNDIDHLSLTSAERELIATKIAAKVPFDNILDEIRDSVTNSDIDRLHLLTKKDLHNIKSCCNLNSEAVQHKNNGIILDAWVQSTETEENCDKICDISNKTYENMRQLNKHKRNVHHLKKPGYIKCAVEDCSSDPMFSMPEYRQHLFRIHGECVLTEENLQFSTREEFENWLIEEEKARKQHFVLKRGEKKFKDYLSVTYVCHRSGFSRLFETGKRKLKSQGSVKMGFHCPANIKLKIFYSHVDVLYHKDHFGHEQSLEHIPLSMEERKSIADKLLQGIQEDRIIQDIKLSMNGTIERKHLITKKDIYNKKQSFGNTLNSKGFVNKSDEKSVNCQDNEMKDNNPVIFYENQDECRPNLDIKDCLLITHDSIYTKLKSCNNLSSDTMQKIIEHQNAIKNLLESESNISALEDRPDKHNVLQKRFFSLKKERLQNKNQVL